VEDVKVCLSDETLDTSKTVLRSVSELLRIYSLQWLHGVANVVDSHNGDLYLTYQWCECSQFYSQVMCV